MNISLLKFSTEQGTKLIFDNNTGIVVPEKDNTEYILKHIDEQKNDVIKGLQELGRYNEPEFEKEYQYLVSLFNWGYFKGMSKIAESQERDFFSGQASQLILITTEMCNMRCRYCVYSDFYADKKTYSSKSMSKETAFRAIDLFKSIHEEKVKRGYKNDPKISFYGGEPLLNFELIKSVVEYVEKIEFENVEYLVTTNGTIMDNAMTEFMAKNNFMVSFSLDGDENNHDRNRVFSKGKYTHEIVVNNLLKYHEKLQHYRKGAVININCCFDDYTDMVAVTNFFEELKGRVQNINFIYNKIYDVDTTYYDYCKVRYSGDNPTIDENLYKESVKSLFNKFYKIDRHRDVPNSVKSMFLSYYVLKNRKKGWVDLLQGNACIIGDKLCVAPDENIYICEKANQEMEIGNLQEGINNEKLQRLYEKYFKIREDYCSQCSVKRMCDACYVHFIKNDDLQYNETFCKKRKEVYVRGLQVVYSLLEEDREIFDLN